MVVGGVADGLIDENLAVKSVHRDATASADDDVSSDVVDAGAL